MMLSTKSTAATLVRTVAHNEVHSNTCSFCSVFLLHYIFMSEDIVHVFAAPGMVYLCARYVCTRTRHTSLSLQHAKQKNK